MNSAPSSSSINWRIVLLTALTIGATVGAIAYLSKQSATPATLPSEPASSKKKKKKSKNAKSKKADEQSSSSEETLKINDESIRQESQPVPAQSPVQPVPVQPVAESFPESQLPGTLFNFLSQKNLPNLKSQQRSTPQMKHSPD